MTTSGHLPVPEYQAEEFGSRLGVLMFPTTPDGPTELESWAQAFIVFRTGFQATDFL
jgi:hypothetical protein